MTVVAIVATLGGCGGGHSPIAAGPSASAAVPTAPVDPAGQLIGLAAAAHDRRYVGVYSVTRHGEKDSSLLVALATDGTWQVDVNGGALSGGANVAIVGLANGTYQCLLGGPATTSATGPATPTEAPTPPQSTTPSSPGNSASHPAMPTGSASGTTSAGSSTTPQQYTAPACVRVARAGKKVPAKYDPVFEHIFTDWLGVMLDRDAPISVFSASFPASPRPASPGACYSVEPNSASLAPAIDSGIFCFTPDGTLTAAKISAGTLVLTGPAVAAPPTTTLPGPITNGPAAPTKAPTTP